LNKACQKPVGAGAVTGSGDGDAGAHILGDVGRHSARGGLGRGDTSPDRLSPRRCLGRVRQASRRQHRTLPLLPPSVHDRLGAGRGAGGAATGPAVLGPARSDPRRARQRRHGVRHLHAGAAGAARFAVPGGGGHGRDAALCRSCPHLQGGYLRWDLPPAGACDADQIAARAGATSRHPAWSAHRLRGGIEIYRRVDSALCHSGHYPRADARTGAAGAPRGDC